jgi:methyl-accepting chemotaxis protein
MLKLLPIIRNAKVGTKLALGFGVLLLLIVGMVGLQQRSMGVLEDSYSESANVSQTMDLVRDIETKLAMMAVSIRDFLVIDSPENLLKIRDRQKIWAESIVKVREATHHQERLGILDRIEATRSEYDKVVDQIISGTTERNRILDSIMSPLGGNIRKLAGEANEAVRAAADFTASSDIGIAIEKLMTGRLSLMKFLVSKNNADAGTAESSLQEFDELLKKIIAEVADQRAKQALSAAQADFLNYRKAAEEFVATIRRQSAAVIKISEIRDSLLDDVAAIRTSQAQSLAEITTTVRNDIAQARITNFGGLAISVLVGVSLALLLTKSIAGAVRSMTSAMTVLASGDTAVQIPGRDRGDEIGAMAAAVQVFKDNAIARIRLEEAQAAESAAKERRAVSVDRLIQSFDRTVGDVLHGVATASTELSQTAESMAALAEQTSRQSTASATASEQTSANVQTVASATEEMGASIQEISRQVSRSTQVAEQAAREAQETTVSVRELAEAANRINEVVNLIQSIASQTNLLALNATIEAARAGEAGKGFAVVASEVKALANQTTKATEEIAGQIAGVQSATQGTVSAIDRIGATITTINDISSAIAAAIEEQNATTGEITRNVQQAAQGTEEVSRNVRDVNQAAEQTGAAASQVLSASGELSKQAEGLKREVETFLTSIRAA